MYKKDKKKHTRVTCTKSKYMCTENHLLYSQIEISKKNNKRDITKICPFLSPCSFRASLFLLLFLTYFFIIAYSYT
jgi:hypothetical protein